MSGVLVLFDNTIVCVVKVLLVSDLAVGQAEFKVLAANDGYNLALRIETGRSFDESQKNGEGIIHEFKS